VARYKSAKYTVERPLLFGAALAGAPARLDGVYSAYGLPLGEAFQLRDDILGVFGDPAQTGKPAGDDLREGKRTYLVAAALTAAGPDERAVLSAGLGQPDLDPTGVIRLREIITSTGALKRTEQRIAELSRTALDELARAVQEASLDPEAATVLAELATAATTRTD
jgi:geranylgeranyl diphosphate synthase type I